MSTRTSFWPRRLRWQLLAAWRWPALIVLTFVDGALASALSPVSGHTRFIPAVIIAAFANLFLVGAVAPWLARRIAARRGHALPAPKFPPVDSGEILVDRVATALLVLGTLGILVAGLGHERPNLAPTKAAADAGDAMRTYVLAHGTAELKRNVDAANTERVRPGYFRICVPHNNPARAFCVFVDTSRKPPVVRPDRNPTPNPPERVIGE
jgi:hypothetical protein